MLINILELFIGTPMPQSNIVIETSGITAALATDTATYGGGTSNFQIMKMAHGISGTVNLASSASPLPVTVMAGLTATISGFSGLISMQGTAAGYPLPVSGTVYAIGVTGSPVYIKTGTGYQVEVTGGRYLGKSTDSVSVWGPAGITYIYSRLVDNNMNGVGVSGGALRVSIAEGGFSANISLSSVVGVTNDGATSGLRVQGLSGGTSLAVTVGNTALGLNDTNILNGITACYNQLVTLNAGLGTTIPSTFKTGRISSSSVGSVEQLDTTGFTCYYGVNLKAISTNTDVIYYGNTSGLDGASFGSQLDPGENTYIKISNTNKIYVKAASGTQVIVYNAS
jgi:hypothetical protein